MNRLLIILLLLPSLLYGHSQVLLDPAQAKEMNITRNASFLKETGKQYSFEQIASGSLEPFFTADLIYSKNELSYERNFWIKIDLGSAAGNSTVWILKTNKLFSGVTAYIVHPGGKTDIQKSGWSVPPAHRSVTDGEVLFQLSLNEKEKCIVYLHVHTDLQWSSVDAINISITPEYSWNQVKLNNYNFLSVYAGICLLATFYWLITYFFSRRANYLYLIAATLSALIFCLDIYGITAVFWPSYPLYMLVKHGQQYLWLPLMVMSHFAISYKANSFVTHFSKRIIFCYWLLCFSTVACLLVSPMLMPWQYSHTISLSLVIICMAGGVMMISYLLAKRGLGSTGFAFLAILPIFAGVTTYIFTTFGILSNKYLIITPVGALLTVIMYFYGMVHYVRVLRDKRNNEILKNDMLIRKQNTLLEKTVEERTSELKIANEELSKTLQDLQETHVQLIETERLKVNEKINTLLKEQELRSVSSMLDVQEGERKRIASDLHDRLGSMLSTVKLYFATVEEQIDKLREQKEQYNKANKLLDEACEEVRKISHDLVSGELVKFGLVSALRQLAKTIEDTGQLKIKVLAFGMDNRLDSSIEIALYRVVQELINNILKHAKATEVTIQLNKMNNELNIVVEDSGIGFDVEQARDKGGMGLKNMETRISKLNGRIQYDSGKGKGTTTIIDIPVLKQLHDKNSYS